MNVRIFDICESYAEQIEDRRALALSSSGAVMLWRTLARADKTIGWSKDSINTIVFTRKHTGRRSFS